MKIGSKLIILLIFLLLIINVNAFSFKEILEDSKEEDKGFFIKLFESIFKKDVKGMKLNSYSNIDEINYQEGWPVYVGNIEGISSAVVADINNDGYNEVIVSSPDGTIRVWNYDGTVVNGFPFDVTTPIYSSPAIADVDNNGFLDIVFNDQYENIYVIDYTGNLIPGWPQQTTNIDNHQLAITVGDIDDDNYMEIVTSARVTGYPDDKLYMFEHDGNLKQNFPINVSDEIIYSSPAIADLDNDGSKEIIVASSEGYSSEISDNFVFVFEYNGTLKQNFPIILDEGIFHSEILSSPIIADINRDGSKEIIVGTRGNKVYIIDSNGNFLSGWPQDTIGYVDNSPAVGDINKDGYLEIFVGAGTTLYGWDYTGANLQGFPILNNGPLIYSSPVIGDIDGDNDVEIMVGSFDHNLYAWHHNGLIVSDFPIELDYEISATLTLSDLDNDGDVEGILPSKGGWIYVWDFEGSPLNLEWPMFQNNIQHTGLYNKKHLSTKKPIINYNVSE